MSEIPLALIVCAGCALAAGAFFVVAGTLGTTRMLLFLRRAERAEGLVVEARLTKSAGCGDTSDVWTLTIEYEDALGVKRRGFIDVARARSLPLRPGQVVARPALVIGPHEYEVGDRVPIRYDPRRPSFVVIDSFAGTWLGLLAVDVIAVVFVVLLVCFVRSAPMFDGFYSAHALPRRAEHADGRTGDARRRLPAGLWTRVPGGRVRADSRPGLATGGRAPAPRGMAVGAVCDVGVAAVAVPLVAALVFLAFADTLPLDA